MSNSESTDVLIVGGSYAGLSAAMSLGRALRNVVVIDSGRPCNRQTPHSHNLITHDGSTPAEIAAKAREQVLAYPTVRIVEDLVVDVQGSDHAFSVSTRGQLHFNAKKIIFAAGIRDIFPTIPGLAECWGISVVHCPYCHGYEYRQEKTGILFNGKAALEMGKLISNWTSDLTIFTNGAATFDDDVRRKIAGLGIEINEKEISHIRHETGYISSVVFTDDSELMLKALYFRPTFEQHCLIPEQMGCNLTDHGYIEVNAFQQTSVPGIYAAGDNTNMMRSLSAAIAAGNLAGARINHEMIEEAFESQV